MAPLIIQCKKLSSVYSPLFLRDVNHLPGTRARSVQFVRQVGRINRCIEAYISERFIANGKVDKERRDGQLQARH